MSVLIQKTDRKIVRLENYDGVCHGCNSPLHFYDEMIVIEIENTDEYIKVVPINYCECSFCGEAMEVMKIYRNLNVTKELAKV